MLPKRIHVLECGPRDGVQIEKKIISVDEKVRLIHGLVDAGVKDIEIGSFVNPKAVPQVANTQEVLDRIEIRPDVKYRVLVFSPGSLDRALSDKRIFREGLFVTATSDTFLKRNLNKSIDETFEDMRNWVPIYRKHDMPVDTFAMMATFGCNLEGDIPISKVLGLIERGEKLMDEFGYSMKVLRLADTMGWASPVQIKRVLGAIQDRWPEAAITLHLHDTRGTGLANVVAAMEMGIIHHDSSIGGLGGCPFAGHKGSAGNISTEDLVFMCQEMGVETGIDLNKLIEVAAYAEEMVEHALPGKVMKAGGLDRFRRELVD